MATETTNPEAQEAAEVPITIHAQYVKDLSFENPDPIAVFAKQTEAQPSISVGIQAHAKSLGDRNFEVVLEVRIDAKREKDVMFIAELSYAGVITLGESVTEDQAGPLIMVETPKLLFPFARNILADVTRDGGFPPLMLSPVDFQALYDQQKEKNNVPN